MEFVINSDIERLVSKLVDLCREELRQYDATGSLSNFTYHINLNGSYFELIFSLQDYYYYLEYGRRAGKQPPIEAIEEWIRVKPIIPYAVNGKVPDTRQLAFLIARKIGRDGTEGKKPLTNAMYSDTAENIIQEIKQAFANQVNDYLIEQIKTIENI